MFTNQLVMFFSLLKFADIVYTFDFIQPPINTTGIEGGVCVLPCRVSSNANGNGPSSSYWTRKSDHHVISENNNTSKYAHLHRELAARLSILSEFQFEYNLRISNLAVDDTGFYECWHFDENKYSHYSPKAYLSVLSRDTATWFPYCSVAESSSFGGVGRTVGSTVRYTCQAPTDVHLPRDVSLYVRSINNGDTDAVIATCDHMPCSFSYTLRLADRSSRFVCGTEINNEVFEEECTGHQLRERNQISLSQMPKWFVLNSVGKLFCDSADDDVEYRYQWFLGETPLTEMQNDNYYTFSFISQNLNNSEVTCVVNDVQGYVGSSSIVIVIVTIPTNGDSPNGPMPANTVGPNDDLTSTKYRKDITTKPLFAPVQDTKYAKEKIFGIPMEVLLVLSCAIVVLLLLLIIIMLLIQRQKRSRRVEHVSHRHHSELVTIGNAEVKVELSNDVIISSHTKHAAISPRGSESEEASFYDNVPSGDEYSHTSHSIGLPYNSNNAKGMVLLATAGYASLNATTANTELSDIPRSDYNVLDPYIGSDDDTLDSLDIEDMREKFQRNFEKEATNRVGQRLSTKLVTRQSSLPVNSPSTLYAVTSLIGHSDGRRSVSILPREKRLKSAPTGLMSPSCQGTRGEYASPCNRPKLKDFSLSSKENSECDDVSLNSESTENLDDVTCQRDMSSRSTSKLGSISGEYAEITYSTNHTPASRSGILSTDSGRSRGSLNTKEDNVIRLERINDGTEKLVVLDDNKYITNTRMSAEKPAEI